jgi:hypothetical protein
MSGIISSLKPNIDDILGVRDEVGAALKVCKIVTRSWSGSELGDGIATNVSTTISPSPRVVEFSFDRKLPEGGAVKHGDVYLKLISKNQFSSVNQVDGTVENPSIEKFYDVGGIKFEVVAVTEKHLWWNVHLRRKSDQR